MDKKYIDNYTLSLKDAISSEVLQYPVVLECGHVFEKLQILLWRKKSKNCPTCRKTCNNDVINLMIGDNFFGVTENIINK